MNKDQTLDFEEIESCFPERGGTTEAGEMVCDAQWLHDFANNVAEKVLDQCAKFKADANRYAFAKTIEGQVVTIDVFRNLGAEKLDDALDAAMNNDPLDRKGRP